MLGPGVFAEMVNIMHDFPLSAVLDVTVAGTVV